ncbi:MAG: hypothetical protein AMXMBFR84_50180 [Candidatus Hydrogenedentota bacterium]
MVDCLSNYIRSARKATGLTVKDLARLIGHGSGSSVSHYEAFKRSPSLKTAILLELALGAPLHKLFEGVYFDAQERIRERAVTLLADLKTAKGRKLIEAKHKWLQFLAKEVESHEVGEIL